MRSIPVVVLAWWLALAPFPTALAAPPPAPASRPVALSVDATDAPRGRFHASLVIPAEPGHLVLAYPRWIQGEHGPTGPIVQMAGLSVTAGGRPLAWRRDPKDLFLFHVDVPQGVDALGVELDYLSPVGVEGPGYGNSPNATPHLLIVDWHDLVLYPVTADGDALQVSARLRLPPGWRHDEGLPTRVEADGTLQLPPVSLTTLLDSPVLAGEHFRTEVLEGGERPAVLSIAADRASALAVPPERLALYQRLPTQARLLFGSRHYRAFHWLVSLSDPFDDSGLEHHESTDIRDRLGFFTDAAMRATQEDVLVHEYVHSWNGKFRRPTGLATRNPQEPLDTELLWIYEGLTRYLGELVLTGRSGLRDPAATRDFLATRAARQDRGRPGRRWRPLVDTAAASPAVFYAPPAWASFRRGADYYDESMLIWLEADVLLREKTGGRRSLDDFCRDFFGGGDGPPAVRAYTRADVEAALGRLAPLDWHALFTSRIYEVSQRAPLGGLEAAGWRLVYDGRPNEYASASASYYKVQNLTLGLGLLLDPAGLVKDVVLDSPAWRGGFGPGMKVVAVGGRTFAPKVLEEELAAAQRTTGLLEFAVEHGDLHRALRVEYRGGVLYPHLERDPSRPDQLTRILAPLQAP